MWEDVGRPFPAMYILYGRVCDVSIVYYNLFEWILNGLILDLSGFDFGYIWKGISRTKPPIVWLNG